MAFILSDIALCVPEDVKAIIDPRLSADSDQLLILLINGFSEFMEKDNGLNRSLKIRKYEEYFNGGRRSVVVSAPPIREDIDFEVWDDPARIFTDTQFKLVLDQDITVNFEYGKIRRVNLTGDERTFIHTPRFENNSRNVKVVYNGGIIHHDPTMRISIIPAALRQAAALQIAYMYKSRDILGISAQTVQGQSATFYSPMNLLPLVKSLIQGYIHFQ